MAVNLKNSKSMNQIQSITTKGVEEANNKIIKDIPLTQIDPNPDNTSIFSLNGIDDLKESIERNGFMGAIEVYLKTDGRYQISAGHRRYEAMKALGRKTIPCIVKQMEDATTVKKKLIESNINIRVLSPIELSRSILYYEKALNEEGFSGDMNKKLASIFNVSESKVTKLKRVNNFIGDITEMASSLNFPYEAFYEAANFSVAQQQRLVSLIKNHMEQFPDAEMSKTLVKQFIQQIKNEAKLEKERQERERILQEARAIAEKEKEKELAAAKEKQETKKEELINEIERERISTNIENNSFLSTNDQSYFSNVIDYKQQNTAFNYDTNEVEALAYEDKYVTNPMHDHKMESAEKELNIDFDLQLYTNRLKNIIEKTDVKISTETRNTTIETLTEILDILKKMGD